MRYFLSTFALLVMGLTAALAEGKDRDKGPEESCADQQKAGCIGWARGTQAEVEEFVREVLTPGKKPTIGAFNRYFGVGSDYELKALFAVCEIKDWTPAETHPRCLSLGSRLAEDGAESLFLVWLRQRIGQDLKLELLGSETLSHRDSYLQSRIRVKLGSHKIQFTSVMDAMMMTIMGELFITQIDDEALEKIYEADLKSFAKNYADSNPEFFNQ